MIPYTADLLKATRCALKASFGADVSCSRTETTLGPNYIKIIFRLRPSYRPCLAIGCEEKSHRNEHLCAHVLFVETEPTTVMVRILSTDFNVHAPTPANPQSVVARLKISLDTDQFSIERAICG